MWSGVLDSSHVLLYNITSITHNHHTDTYSQTNKQTNTHNVSLVHCEHRGVREYVGVLLHV